MQVFEKRGVKIGKNCTVLVSGLIQDRFPDASMKAKVDGAQKTLPEHLQLLNWTLCHEVC